MSESAFLSSEDVATLTGRKLKSCQVVQLRKMGIPFYINASGRPIVTRSAVEGRPPEIIKKTWEPHLTT
ncbi:MAG: DUF4224 domain-containing protein [Nitrosomonas sp.]|mgnify:CR=1 FL=1|nr:MAG: DUF4224 domain-containing protein [Nitrosomonas sp.]